LLRITPASDYLQTQVSCHPFRLTGVHPASHQVCTGGSFCRGKVTQSWSWKESGLLKYMVKEYRRKNEGWS
jgi:hypothetical protein